jgi:hypothetical protein
MHTYSISLPLTEGIKLHSGIIDFKITFKEVNEANTRNGSDIL